MKLKTGDRVVVISGSNKGKEGKITHILKKENKVVVEGINLVKKHLKPNSNGGNGEIVEREAPIHVSNVKKLEEAPKKEAKKETKAKDTKEVKKVKKSTKKDD